MQNMQLKSNILENENFSRKIEISSTYKQSLF